MTAKELLQSPPALPAGAQPANLRLALDNGFPWTRVRLESGAVEADLAPEAPRASSASVRTSRCGSKHRERTRAQVRLPPQPIEAPADKDARARRRTRRWPWRRSAPVASGAAAGAAQWVEVNRARQARTATPSSRRVVPGATRVDGWGAAQARHRRSTGTISARWRGGRKRRRDRPALAARRAVRPGKAQRRGLRRPKGRRPPPGPAGGRARGRVGGQGPPRGDAPVPDRGFGQVAPTRRRAASWRAFPKAAVSKLDDCTLWPLCVTEWALNAGRLRGNAFRLRVFP